MATTSFSPPSTPLLVLRNADILAPSRIGLRDIVISGETIIALLPAGSKLSGLEMEEIDAAGQFVCPGFVDNHVHTLGGGGGLGFSSRAPEIQASQLARAGITTIIGMLGFDATSKSMAALVSKTKGLREDGLSAYCLTGATLEHPVPSLTGQIRTDIAFVDEIIGVGELSISELGYGYDSFGKGAQYVAEAAVAGLLAGRLSRKAGYCCLQVPPYLSQVLKPMFEVVDRTGIPITQFIPSHVNQTDGYMDDAIAWGLKGGWVDIGANYSPENNYARATLPHKAYTRLREAGVPAARILISSDGNGAPPKEEKGENKPKVANYMPMRALLAAWRRIVLEEEVDLSDALAAVTSNVARATGLAHKGELAPGKDADLLVLNKDLELVHVLARGRPFLAEGQLVRRGMFDDTLVKELS
ncbi:MULTISPECIES: amidohydrolase family protein [Bradyrhizobium]|uniref:amidohydrolase family protein n=1 Tax=Bradyrhizobium TaxID=374 RepID=UPI000423E23D|nr:MULTISPECIES: amidohydrolase family protein [Bradyrhizobium]UFW51192.1 amidohydrolase family protein [Bradyrhizobium arachidis]